MNCYCIQIFNLLYLYFFVAKKQVKQKFVTTHQLQQQQMMKKTNQCDKPEKRNTKMLPQVGTRKSPRLNKMQETTDHNVLEMPASSKRKLDLEGPEEDEIMGENEPEVTNLLFHFVCCY